MINRNEFFRFDTIKQCGKPAEKRFVVKHVLAANESTFMPSVTNDAAFLRWAQHTTMRILNCESTDVAVRSAICAEGMPSPEWAQGLNFLGTITNRGG